MKNNDVFAADSDSLEEDISFYGAMFEKYIQQLTTEKEIRPEITTPLLERYGDESGKNLSPFKATLYAFIGGFTAGFEFAEFINGGENSNSTNIE